MGRVVRSGTPNHQSRIVMFIAAGAILLAACGSGSADSPSAQDTTTTSVQPTTTTSPPPTTTTTIEQTTTSSTPQTALEKLGFPVSDEWVVETVVRDIVSATGGLAVDADGNFYQADFGGYDGNAGNAVYKISPDGEVEVFATSDDMAALTMTVLADDGTIYQSAYGANKVFKISPTGEVTLLAEGIRGPAGIVVNDDGSLIVEAYNSNKIHLIATDGTVTDWVTDPRFNGINGIAEGDDGTLYIIDHKDGSIFSVSADGSTVEKLFKFPKPTSHGVFLDGKLYVTSRGGYVVFSYDIATGGVEIVAGNGEPGDRDGRGGESSFGRPNAITVGPDGALYTNHGDGTANDPVTIRRISRQP